MDFSNHKFRCSSLGYIMVDAKGKSNLQKYNDVVNSIADKDEKYRLTANKTTQTALNLLYSIKKLEEKKAELEPIKDVPHLSDTCKTHLADIYTLVKYGRSDDIKVKYLEKGLLLEEDAITKYCLHIGVFRAKNKLRAENEWIIGEMDIDDGKYATDTKVSWSIFQYGRLVAKPLKPMNKWQVKGYMWLWNKEKGRVVYVLLDTPEHLIKLEERSLLYDFIGTPEDYQAACAETRYNHTYGDIPEEEKIRIFSIDRDLEDEEKLKARIEDCRKYLNNIEAGKVEDDYEEE